MCVDILGCFRNSLIKEGHVEGQYESMMELTEERSSLKLNKHGTHSSSDMDEAMTMVEKVRNKQSPIRSVNSKYMKGMFCEMLEGNSNLSKMLIIQSYYALIQSAVVKITMQYFSCLDWASGLNSS